MFRIRMSCLGVSYLIALGAVQSLQASLQQQSHGKVLSTHSKAIPRRWTLYSTDPVMTVPESVKPSVPVKDDKTVASSVVDIGTDSSIEVREPLSLSSTPLKGNRWSHNEIQQFMVLTFMCLSGSIEAICWRRYKCFPNMMTGHTVKVLDAIAGWQLKDAIWGTAMISSYFLGGTLYKMIHLLQQQQQQQKQESSSQGLPLPSLIVPNTLTAVARWAFLSFAISDFLALRLQDTNKILWCLPFLSVGFGMINAAILELFGSVTNAVTGHWTKMSTGLAEGILLGFRKGGGPSPASKASAIYMIGFSISLIVTSGIMQGLGSSVPTWFSSLWGGIVFGTIRPFTFQSIPSFGITLGLMYGILFTGYARYYERYENSK